MLIEYKVLACMENNDVSMVLLGSLEGSSVLIELVGMIVGNVVSWPGCIPGIVG